MVLEQHELEAQSQHPSSLEGEQVEGAVEQESTCGRAEVVAPHALEMRRDRSLCAALLPRKAARVAEAEVPYQAW